MQVISETSLRDMHLGKGDSVTISREDFVTESARNYAFHQGIELKESKYQSMSRTRINAYAETPYVDDLTGQGYSKKPESMTHIRGNRLVPKTDPRIAFRGKLDTLEAEIILLQYDCSKYGEPEMLRKLTELLELTRSILGAEVKGEPMPAFKLFGMDENEMRKASHNVQESMGMEHPVPSYRMGILCARLNHLRTQVRETELAAANAFDQENREDIILALNRMSSAVYLMFLEGVKKHG